MKRPKSVFVGIVCGILCAVSVFTYTQNVRGEVDAARAEALARYGGEQLEICVATKDVSVGETLDASNTTTKLWVADLLPAGAIESVQDVSGQQLGSPVFAGEVITDKRFSRTDQNLEIPAGTSVLSIPVKDVQAVGGAVCPGLCVDVYATGASGTERVAQNVPVVSTNALDENGKADGAISWVTLAVRPDSVQEIISASQKTELYLVLPGSEKEGEKQ